MNLAGKMRAYKNGRVEISRPILYFYAVLKETQKRDDFGKEGFED